MNSATIKIHEFSTGIQAEMTSDGRWVSHGFVGEYMNRTVDPIPASVQSAIANREFAVAEGTSSDDPAIIGREVRSGGQDWSVIAVVIRGRDDKGRKPTMYRYFLCEGAGNLSKILAWIYFQPQGGPMPVFNPFETKIVGQPNEYRVPNESPIFVRHELRKLLVNNVPVIVPFGEKCTALIVNQMATEKAIENGQPVAWAFQAEALEQPRSFLVIQPASEKAEQLLHRAIASTPQYTAPITGEYEIKSAIKGLISRENVKLEQVQAIETALNQVQDSDWEVIFNAQGAAQARSQGIYSPQMVRLLTLRAIVLPETLPEFLSWMQNRGKQEDHYQVSETFQSEIKSSIKSISAQESNLSIKVTQGVKLIIPRLIDKPELLNATVWLLKYSEGIWQLFYNKIVNVEIENNLKLMINLLRYPQNKQFNMIDDEGWKRLLGELKFHWNQRSYPQNQYLPLAELFRDLEQTEMAAFFYQLSLGSVPKKIFSQLNHEGWNSDVSACGMRVKKQVNFPEKLFFLLIEIGGKEMRIVFVIPLIILSFLGGIWCGGIFKDFKKLGSAPVNKQSNADLPGSQEYSKNSQEQKISEDLPNPEPQVKSNSSQNDQVYTNAMTKQNFDDTLKSIDIIVREVRQENSNKYESKEVIDALKQVLKIRGLDYGKAKNGDMEQRKMLVEAIYSYQYRNLNKGFGYIKSDVRTTIDSLKEDVKNNLDQ
jgi:hypothetical protein